MPQGVGSCALLGRGLLGAPASEAGVCVLTVGVARHRRPADWASAPELLHEALRLAK